MNLTWSVQSNLSSVHNFSLFIHHATKFLTAQINATSHDKMECSDWQPDWLGNSLQQDNELFAVGCCLMVGLLFYNND